MTPTLVQKTPVKDGISDEECQRLAQQTIDTLRVHEIAKLRTFKHPIVLFNLIHEPDDKPGQQVVEVGFGDMGRDTPQLMATFAEYHLGPNDLAYAVGEVVRKGWVKLRTAGGRRDFFKVVVV